RAPTRKQILRSREVLPALAEAMQTPPPMVMANAKYAGSVQPRSRNIAQVAISVAIAIPEIGLDDVPINPVMREDTVTNRNPKTTTSRAAKKFSSTEVC